MKIYRIRLDVNKYQNLDQSFGDTATSQGMNAMLAKTSTLTRCQGVTEPLTPPEVYSSRPRLMRPNFWSFSLYHTFAVPPVTLEKVRHFLEASGELLPLPYKSEIFSVLNVLNCVSYRVFSENVPGHLHQESTEDKIPFSIFRDSDRVYLYIAERTGDPATEFKAFVEHEKMTGLIFREIWDSEI